VESPWLWYVEPLAEGFDEYVDKDDLVEKVRLDSTKFLKKFLTKGL